VYSLGERIVSSFEVQARDPKTASPVAVVHLHCAGVVNGAASQVHLAHTTLQISC
jgi:hypothetical protein